MKVAFPGWFRPAGGFAHRSFSEGEWSELLFLSRFNDLWPDIRSGVRFWRSQSVPARFNSYAEFSQLPLTHRASIQACPENYYLAGPRVVGVASTGGSTGQPLRFPQLREELEIGRQNQIFARRLYNIEPGDRCFMIWGHAAVMDSRLRARLDQLFRKAKDILLGYRRLSAYRLDREILARAFCDLRRLRPVWIYSYSSSLLALVRANAQHAAAARQLGVKACICAAEPLSPEAKAEIENFFGCKVALEYGSVEMRVCAHTHPERPGYYVFTDQYLIEALPSPQEAVYDIAVTKLFAAGMPLVRYLVGDQIRVEDRSFRGGPVVWFDDVYGRTNDDLVLEDGTQIHSETVTHAIRSESSILYYQLHQYSDRMELRLVTRDESISAKLQADILGRLLRVHPAFERLKFVLVADVEISPAGKRRWIVRHTQT